MGAGELDGRGGGRRDRRRGRIHHIGGVRLDSIPRAAWSAASVYGLEPFGTLVAEMKMTPADMRRMIVSKYNDPVNVKEAHRIDLISTTPYVIVTDQADNALDVEFPKLREGKVTRSPSAITSTRITTT
ncbi:MAG: hypothetical protein ACLRM8_08255 [Alistipes sp.]